MTFHFLLSELYFRLTAVSVAGLWQGAVFVLLATGVLRLMPRASARLKHGALVAIFVFAGILPWLHPGAIRAQGGSGHALRIPPLMAAIVAGVWMTVALVRMIGLFIAWRQLQAIRQRAVPFRFEGIDRYIAGDRQALLCTSSEVDSPTILGFVQPRLLLPDWMAPQLTAGDLHQISLHECEHLRRYDDWLNLLLQIGLILSPLNPALIWLDRHVGIQRELACDAAVVASTAQPVAYATCLTRLAEQRIHRNRLVLALAALGHGSELGQRVHALLVESAAWTQKQSRLAGGATAVLLLAGCFGLARTPPFLQMASAPQAETLASTPTIGLPGEIGPGSRTRSMGEHATAGARALPAAFLVKAPTEEGRCSRMKRISPIQPKAGLTTRIVTPQASRTLLTSATVWPRPRRERATRLITADFSSPYVVVPVENGWLIFQL
jgi:beta-lactamase regulating signal transducer with metallopeptidase domain